MRASLKLMTAATLAALFASGRAQNALTTQNGSQPALDVSGQIILAGRTMRYLIRRLPITSFPALPAAVQSELNRRGCLVPQTYEAHQPENVLHADLEGRGKKDWAVLCSAQGTVSLLVFFDGNLQPALLASAPETERLQIHDASGVLGFNWAIDPVSPRQVADAQIGMSPRPPLLDHDALAESIVDHKTIYHFYAKNAWTLVKMPD